jgi:hypothetical protein
MRAVVSEVVRQSSKDFLARSHSFLDGHLRNYALDALLLIVLVLGIAALWRDFHVSPPKAPGSAAVGRNGGLEPFHVIAPSDLLLSCQSRNPPSQEIAGTIVGRYSTEYLKACAPIDATKLSSGPRLSTELNGRIVVRLKVQPTTVFTGMPPPYKAALMVSSRERGTATLFLNDIMVLDLQKDADGTSAVLAILASDESTLAAFIARSDLFLVAGPP